MTQSRLPLACALSIACWCCWPAAAAGQTTPVTGVVVDASNSAVAGAAVSLAPDTGGGAVGPVRTDAEGRFALEAPAPGRYRLHVAAAGFEPLSQAIPIGDVAPAPLRIILGVAGVQEQLVVVARDETGYVAARVQSATKSETPLLEVPQAISVLTSARIADRRPVALNEVLHEVAGVADTGSRRGFDFPNIRGFDASASNVFLDGLRVERGNFNVAQELSHLSRVEILKGPGAVLFGQGPPGGLINQVSRTPPDQRTVDLAVGAGSFGWSEFVADVGGRLGGSDAAYRIGATARRQDDFVDVVGKDRLYVAPSLRTPLGARTTATWLGTYVRDRKTGNFVDLPAEGTVLPNVNGAIARQRYSGEPTEDRVAVDRTQAGYRLVHAAGDWSVRQHVRATFSDVLSAGKTLTALDASRRRINRAAARFDQDERTLAVDTQVARAFRTGAVLHEVLAGVDYYGQRIDQVFSFGGAAPLDLFTPVYGVASATLAPALDLLRTDHLLGAYVQNQLTLGDRWTALVGARLDSANTDNRDRLRDARHSQTDVAVVPRAGVVFRATPFLSAYASYGRGFNPNFGVSSGGVAFDPETGAQFDAGFKIEQGGRLTGTLSVYRLTREQVLTADPAAPGFSQAVGAQQSRGVEAEVAWQAGDRLSLTASYGFTDVFVERDSTIPAGQRPRSVPRHAGTAWARTTLWQAGATHLSAGGGVRLVGEREGTLPNSYQLPGYSTADVAVFARHGRWRLQVNLLNAFDTTYYASASPVGPTNVLFGEPRTLRTTLGWSW